MKNVTFLTKYQLQPAMSFLNDEIQSLKNKNTEMIEQSKHLKDKLIELNFKLSLFKQSVINKKIQDLKSDYLLLEPELQNIVEIQKYTLDSFNITQKKSFLSLSVPIQVGSGYITTKLISEGDRNLSVKINLVNYRNLDVNIEQQIRKTIKTTSQNIVSPSSTENKQITTEINFNNVKTNIKIDKILSLQTIKGLKHAEQIWNKNMILITLSHQNNLADSTITIFTIIKIKKYNLDWWDLIVCVKKDGIDGGDVLDVNGVNNGDHFQQISKSILSINRNLNSVAKQQNLDKTESLIWVFNGKNDFTLKQNHSFI